MRTYNQNTHFRNWSKEESTALRNGFLKGDSIKSLAKNLNRNEDAIVFRLVKIGILGFSQDNQPSNHGKLWNDHEKTQLLKEYKNGLPIDKIAEIHGRQKNSILFKLIELRIIDISNRSELSKYMRKDMIEIFGKPDVGNVLENTEVKIMSFERVPFDTTIQHEEKGLLSGLSGKKDAIFLRNKYQKELDNAHASMINMIHYVQEQSAKLKSQYNFAQGLKRDLEAHEVERKNAYDALGNLLNKETNFEKEMHKETAGMYKEISKNSKTESIKIRQRNIGSDNEMSFAAMMKYLEKYPEYQSKSSFKKILDKIEEKEKEIRQSKKEYNEAVSKYNYLLSEFETHIQKSEDKIVAYHKVYEEGKRKLEGTRFKKGIFYKLASEETKAKVELDTLQHRTEQFKNTLEIVKKEHAENQRKTFKELDY